MQISERDAMFLEMEVMEREAFASIKAIVCQDACCACVCQHAEENVGE